MASIAERSHWNTTSPPMENIANLPTDDLRCFYLPIPVINELSKQVALNLITSIINIVAAPFAVVANSLIAFAIFKNSRLRTPSNLFIGCLALSDVLVGLIVQPGYIAYRLMALEDQFALVPCFVRISYANTFFVCFGVSFMTLSAVSYERLVAVRFHARYNAVFSSKRVLNYMLAIWSINIVLTALQWAGVNTEVRAVHLMLWFTCLLVSVATQFGILLRVRRHKRQLQPYLRTSQNIQKQKEVKIAITISLIVVVYLVLIFPVLFVTLYNQILGFHLKTSNHYSWTETLAFLNSCSNPLMCYWKNRQIRQQLKAFQREITHLQGNTESRTILRT